MRGDIETMEERPLRDMRITRSGSGPQALLWMLFAVPALLIAALPGPVAAGHDLGRQCYDCHNIGSAQVWGGSYAIWNSKPIGMSPYSRAITCDVCHTDYGAKFRNDTVNKSWHPVRIIAGNQTLPDNTIADYGNNPDFIDCGTCHYGNVTAATPNLNPDVAPYVFAIPQTDNTTDGYPNHDNTIAGYILTQASWSGQNVVTAGTEPHLGLTYNKTPGDNNAALTNYALCFSCHDGAAGKTNRRVDVKTKYTQGAGHYYKASGNRMPCSDCHTSHGSTSSRLFAKPANARTPGPVVYSNPVSPTVADNQAICTDCHDDYNAGNTLNGTPLIRGVEPSARAWGVAEHDTASGASCMTSGCHDAHDAPAKCNSCHGTASDGSGRPPDSPKSGARVWSSSVDRVGNALKQGLHRMAPADNAMRTDHEALSCAECHTPTPGSGANHNDGGPNATMDNLTSRFWTNGTTPTTWTPRTNGADNSVVDDSCNNVNCHSPFGPYQTTQPSGTPFPYARYWENYTLWDCYTCHGYRDSDTVTDNANNPGGLDRHIDTGSHDRHTRTAAKGGLGYDCVRCHATGNATLYSAAAPAGDNAYPGTHKTGYVEWSFAGAPNPFNVVAASRTYSGSPSGGTGFAPTDNAGTHRKYGSCANLYCHSIGQTASGGALTADNTSQYRPPRWDNTFGGKCGDCHAGDGVVDNTLSVIASGSHSKHVGTAGALRYACSACHSGLGRGSAKHADNQVSLSFGALGSVPLAGAAYSQGLDNAAGNNFGKCTALYCHGRGTPALSGGVNQMVLDNATWGNAATAACGTCHGAPGGASRGASNYPTSGAHAMHFDNTRGPQLPATAAGCGNCHRASTDNTHVDGDVDFKTAFNDNAAATLAATRVCDPCHGAGSTQAKQNWASATALDCLTCHGSTRATSNYDNTGRVAPNMGGDNSTYGAAIRGHNRSSALGPYPGTSNPAANRACADCHDLAIDHIDGTDNTTYAGNRLLSTVNGAATGSSLSALCEACHKDPTGPVTPSKRRINRHGNTGYPGRLEPATFSLECLQCHEPHGMVNVSTGFTGVNLWMIDPTVTVKTGLTVSPVRLFSKTGAYSFNAYDPGAGGVLDNTAYTSNAGDQLCVVCHANAANTPNFPMTRNIAGRHNAPNYTGNESGKDCAGCHSHNQDDNTATVDGLMPLACNACHSYPGIDNSASVKQMSAVHAEHVGTPSGTANSREYDCTVCHYNYNHNQCRVAAGSAWPATYYDNVNIDFDPAINPANTRGPKYRNVVTPTTGNGGADGSTCDGIYCHGNNDAQTGWGGTTAATPPQWDNTPTASCGSCHNAGTVMPQGNHPAHLTAAYGPGSASFTASGTCSEGAGCHTAYGLSLATTHANGQPSFRLRVSATGGTDNTPVGLGATLVCQNCHSNWISSQGRGDNLVRTRANWDNTSYKVACVTCHNDAPAANNPPNAQASVNLDGTGNRAPDIDNQYYLSGHGKAPVNALCTGCHGAAIGHIGAGKVATNPWRLSTPNLSLNGGLDNTCATACHVLAASDHAWRVTVGAPVTSETKEATDTHPTSTASVGSTDKSRWFRMPTDNNIPLQGNLTQQPHTKTSTENIVCVSCHDPHGVAASALPASVRNFSGSNDNAYKMLRYNNGSLNSLCVKCHL